MKRKRVVITGIGVVAPNASNCIEFTDALFHSKSGITTTPDAIENKLNCTVGGHSIVNLGKLFNTFPTLNIPIISRSTLLLAQACHEALGNANLLDNNKDLRCSKNIDIIVGSTIGSSDLWGNKIVKLVDSKKHLRLGSFAFEQIINSSPASMISGLFKTTGRVMSTSLACASSTEAIAEATNKIRYENKEIVIAGGVDPYSLYYWATMDAMRITNTQSNSNPEKASRPMSATAAGFVPAEGSGVLVIEEYNHAKARNATIYAELVGAHVNSGGQDNGGSMTSSNPAQLERCISEAISDSMIDRNDIDYISGHLTGTKADLEEIKVWKRVLGNDVSHFPYINSTKSLIGHTLGACGAIETIAAIIQAKNKFIHASTNSEDIKESILEQIPRNSIVQKRIDNIDINYFAKANYGFGDVNACLILKNIDE